MANNINGKLAGAKIVSRNLHDRMAKYDALPKELREIIANAPYSFSAGSGFTATELKKRIKETIRQSALATYGPNHPEAK